MQKISISQFTPFFTNESTETSPPPSSGPMAARFSRRAFLRLGATLAAGLAVGACAALENNFLSTATDPAPASLTVQRSSPTRDEIQLVYQDWRTDWFPEMVEEMLGQFHETHPDIRVFFTPDPDNLAEAMAIEMAAGTAPDLFWGGSTTLPAWAQQGHLLDLRSYVAADLDELTIADWDPVQYRAFFLRDGRQFGLPKYHGALGLYYNKDLFDQAGVGYPAANWTHTEYLTAMRQLSRNNAEGVREQWGSMVDIAWDRIQVHVNGWGGHLVAPHNPALCTFDQPDTLAALEWLRAAMWDERVMAAFPDVQYLSPRSAFINQHVAIVEEGSWSLKEILLNADFRVGVAPMPSGPAQRVTLATSDGFGIYTRTEYPDAAWELLKFLTDKTYSLAMAKANFLQPARASLADAWSGFVHAEFPEQAQDLDLAAFVDGHVNGYSVTVEIANNMSDVQKKAEDAFEKLLTLGQEPVDSLHAVCRQINRLQNGFEPQLPHLAE